MFSNDNSHLNYLFSLLQTSEIKVEVAKIHGERIDPKARADVVMQEEEAIKKEKEERNKQEEMEKIEEEKKKIIVCLLLFSLKRDL